MPFSFERSATSPPQADHVLVVLFSSAADGGLSGQSSPTEKAMKDVHRGGRKPRIGNESIKVCNCRSDPVALLVRASAKVVGLISGQGTYKYQPMNA